MLNKDIKVHKVPKGIRYISDWEEFRIFDFPHILDKQIPGCGFTEYCLTNSENIILCSPRRILMQNKYDQHSGDVFLVKSKYEDISGVDKDLENLGPKLPASVGSIEYAIREQKRLEELAKKREEESKKEWLLLRQKVTEYIKNRVKSGKPVKILVTYDSFRKLKEIVDSIDLWSAVDCNLPDNRLDYRVVIDEFQSIFTDSRFKSSTELEFVTVLRNVSRVCYVSATPMIDSYLKRLEEFKDLPYYELDWKSEDPGRVQKPMVSVHALTDISRLCRTLIGVYTSGDFYREYRINPKTGKPEEIVSKELVIYVNSVNNITRIVKSCKLRPEQVNILCADTEKNRNTIKTKLGKLYSIGQVPLRDEPRKTITLCTRTVYLGADFYSDNARSIVISDANINCMAVDITLDLPQILGRQRLEENPWKNEVILYVRCIMPGNVKLQEEFESMRERKLIETGKLLKGFFEMSLDSRQAFANKVETVAKDYHFKDDYAAVNNHLGSGKVLVENKLVQIAEERAYDIQQVDYKDRFSVFSSIQNSLHIDRSDVGGSRSVDEFLQEYQDEATTKEKLRVMCEFPFDTEQDRLDAFMQYVPVNHRNYYNTLGPDRLRSLGYNVTRIRKYIEDSVKSSSSGDLSVKVGNAFKVGDQLSNKLVKENLKTIYNELGYNSKVAKASDLGEWFNTKSIKVKNQDTGKWEHGLEILGNK